MRHHRHSPRLTTTLVAATTLVTIVLSPAAALPRMVSRTRRVRDDEDGEIVQNILWVAGFAAIAIAVIALIRTFVLTEAENLPTSDTVGP